MDFSLKYLMLSYLFLSYLIIDKQKVAEYRLGVRVFF